uniref:YJU2 splicing factor homolog n=1 Tax=Paramormyrops kingsleyae TaxID=1676925 RepID=A0A3B3TD47_9TELE|nr:SH2 domain-containing adapter protein D-like isoform X1 [Paramormyrops kingsleyae]XP_023699300.1 SH2 domain-containing adapter protein D-like isoform X1 [Paramormyrops kingsleyae]XP_023699301.1 SH2 domain-containing adapter protein D-like isoform X1 [Paramormyrops kingsleyae]XP_023699302.1 SH2 domain-containing adapter protein D-like isoform X1 [Paramormyrops kingsleyae]XP_023699303.1 SH2 domain-containing adapter protein D-like isoform X1 [Paramormyrops kingsleyae]
MAKWLKDYLSFGSRRVPPQPPKPDYTESEILKAYRIQKSLDFEDPYEESEKRARSESGAADVAQPGFGSPLKSGTLDMKILSPKHRLIKVESQDLGRSKILLSAVSIEEPPVPVIPSAPAVGDTDYSDPFDARSDPRSDPDTEQLPPENNGYMEPFEAQRVITELQWAPAGGHPRCGFQLYDTPYEERAPGGPEEGRESRLPRDDERPADEYDQPWEWKKDHISKALAVQFEAADWERSPFPSERLHQARLGAARHRKPADGHAMLGERVDPTLPLEKQVWYHGSLSRSEAESLLTLCKECSYLVRTSQTGRSDYSLSLRSCQGFMHMKFTVSKEGKHILGQNSPPFDTIPEVVHYYTTHKLPIKGAEHLSLLFPVLVQTL